MRWGLPDARHWDELEVLALDELLVTHPDGLISEGLNTERALSKTFCAKAVGFDESRVYVAKPFRAERKQKLYLVKPLVKQISITSPSAEEFERMHREWKNSFTPEEFERIYGRF